MRNDRRDAVTGKFSKKPLLERFWPRVTKTEGCWVWTGSHTHTGYGVLWNAVGRTTRAHRLSWELHNGAIPAGLEVLHKCDNPPCVRPDHLFLGTKPDNVADKVAKQRQPRGITNGMAKLSEETVKAIRAEYIPRSFGCPKAGRWIGRYPGSQQYLADKFGLNRQLIQKIVTGRRWKHLIERPGAD